MILLKPFLIFNTETTTCLSTSRRLLKPIRMRYFTLLLFILATHVSLGQCPPPTAYSVVENGDLKITVRQGVLPMSAADNVAGVYFTRDGVDIPLVYSAGSWIGGVTPDQQLKLAASSYGQDVTDFFAGPLTDDGTATATAESCFNYDQQYVIYKSLVLRHTEYFNCLSDPDCSIDELFPLGYVVPEVFFAYPANGDVAENQSLQLSPYHDFDGDGMYDPSMGDYPFFDFNNESDGCCDELKGDICVYSISNDKGNVHSFSNGEQIGLELHQMVYVFASEEMNDVVFNSTKYINRGTQTLQDTYLGHFIDADLGNAQDDLFGSEPQQDMVFFYNGDDFDENAFDENAFGDDLPVLAYKLLEGPPQDDDAIDNDNDGVVDNETLPAAYSIGDDPSPSEMTSPVSFYNWLQGLYADGTNSDEDFQYPGIPNGSEDLFPSDKRQLISSGPFTLEPGVEFCTTEALFYNFSDEGEIEALKGFNGLTEKAEAIQVFSDGCASACLTPTVDITTEAIGDGFTFWNITGGTSYLWDFGDGNTSQLPFPQHIYPTDGEYTVTLTIENECGSATGAVVINTEVIVGVKETVESFTLFPQPASDLLNLRLEQKLQGALIRVSDMTGKIVMEATVQNELNQINTAPLANGMYILEIVSNELQLQPQQFIVRH